MQTAHNLAKKQFATHSTKTNDKQCDKLEKNRNKIGKCPSQIFYFIFLFFFILFFYYYLFVFFPLCFFSCIAERARGMVGQLPRNAKAKKGETGITCRSLSTGLESRKQNKQSQTNNTNTTQKR